MISMKPSSNLNHFQQLLFHTIPPPLAQYNLFFVLQKMGAKPLLRRQNCVTSTGGRHTIVPGLHSYSRGPAWSFIKGDIFSPPIIYEFVLITRVFRVNSSNMSEEIDDLLTKEEIETIGE